LFFYVRKLPVVHYTW